MKTHQAPTQNAQHVTSSQSGVYRSHHPWYGAGKPLDPPVRAVMESHFRHNFGDIRIHDSQASAEIVRLMQVSAYTIGNDIAFARGRYRPRTTSGRALLAHELAHSVQQAQGGPKTGQAHERDAEAAAKVTTRSGIEPIAVEQRARVGIAYSVDDWLMSTPSVEAMSYSEIVNDIREINEWLGRQNTSTPESARLEEALGILIAERQRKEKSSLSDKRKKSRRRKNPRKSDTATAEDTQRQPRILRERTSVQYASANEVNEEVDLIMAWLARDDVSKADRALLKTELEMLAPQFARGMEAATEERRAVRLQRAFQSADGNAANDLKQVSQVLRNLVPDPETPNVFLIFHQGEQLRISGEQVSNLRKEIAAHFRRGAKRTKQRISDGFGRYNAQVEVNREHPIISSIAGWLGDAGDPIMAMTIRKAQAQVYLEALEKYVMADDFPAAANSLIAAETLGNQVYAAGLAFNEKHIEGASLAVKGLEFTRDVSFAIAGTIAAVVAAPVVAAGAAGAGLTGATATGVTALGTGAIVGSGSAVVRGGSAGIGELAAGNSLDEAAAAATKEGKRGAREGFVSGLTGGLAHSAGTALGVGKEGLKLSSQLGRRAAAEGSADFVGGTTDALLQGKSLDEALISGGKTTAFGAPGSVVGGLFKNPGTRAAAETITSGGTAFTATLASGGSTEEAIASGSVAAISSVAVRRAAANSTPTTEAQIKAFDTGKRARESVNRLGRNARDATAAVMLGVAEPVPALRMQGSSGAVNTEVLSTTPGKASSFSRVEPETTSPASTPSVSQRQVSSPSQTEARPASSASAQPASQRQARGPEVWEELSVEMALEPPGTGQSSARGVRTAVQDARAAGLVSQSGDAGTVDLAFQTHGSAPAARQALGVTGAQAQSAHVGPTSALRGAAGYSRSGALTTLLDSQTHAAFDNHWKNWAIAQRRAGRTHCTARELESVMLDAVEQIPGLPQRTKNTLAWRLQMELRELGLSPDATLALPYPNIRPQP